MKLPERDDSNRATIDAGKPDEPASNGRPHLDQRRTLACIALFWSLSAAFFWQPLFQGDILVPTSPLTFQPWEDEDPGTSGPDIRSNPLMGDALFLTVPWRLYNHDMLRRADLPFWNPFIFSGYPHLAALQSNALYPLTVIFDLLDPLAGIARAMALHLALAGTFMFWFLRRLGLPLAAATLGGVLFEFNGFFLVRMSAPSYVFTGIWAPLLLVGLHDLIRRRSWRSSWKIVLATSFALFGGHPQVFVLVMSTGLAYALFLLWPEMRCPENRRRALGAFLLTSLAVAFGLGSTGVQLLPFLELVQETARSPVGFPAFQKLTMPVTVLAQTVVPDFFGHPIEATYWLSPAAAFFDPTPATEGLWGVNYSGENLFTGVVPVLLSLYAMYRARSRETLFFGALASFALLVLFGFPAALRLLHVLVPTFQYSRPDRILYIYMLALPVLAALGYAGASQRHTRPLTKRAVWVGRSFLVAPFLPTLLALASDPVVPEAYRHFFRLASRQIRLNAAVIESQVAAALGIAVVTIACLWVLASRPQSSRWTSALLLVMAVFPLFRFGWNFNPVQEAPLFPKSRTIERLQSETEGSGRIVRVGDRSLPANTAQIFGLFDVNGVSAAALGNYARLIDEADPRAIRKQKYFRSFQNEAVLESNLFDFLNVDLVLSQNELSLPELPHLSADLGFRVFENPDRLPRFFLVDRVETYLTAEAGVRRLLSREFEPGRAALVAATAGIALSSEDSSNGDSGQDSVALVSYGAHAIELAVEAPGERLLVSSEVDYPGWEVSVDGHRARKVLVNTAFRGVVVPAGKHRVRFRFVPRSFYVGLGVTLVSCGLYLVSLFRFQRPPQGDAL